MRPNSKSTAPESGRRLDLTACIRWRTTDARFCDTRIIRGFDPGRDAAPGEITEALSDASAGTRLRYSFAAGSLIAERDDRCCLWLPRSHFRPPPDTPQPQPVVGRYYPTRYLVEMDSPCRAEHLRIRDMDAHRLFIDFNHPLAGQHLELRLEVDAVRNGSEVPTGSPRDLTHELCDGGPGMQAHEPAFDPATAFARLDEDPDADFFSRPSLSPYWETPALHRVSREYRRLIPPASRVLDLMAGVHSPLQEADIDGLSVHCAGLNRIELEHNPLCDERRALDVNVPAPLPWPDGHFDAVLIHAAIEYVIRPCELFDEVHRILRPGGRFIISFGNCWVDEKVIRIWTELQEFERPALLLSWLRRQGGFARFEACSLRGLPGRPDRLQVLSADKAF